MYRYPLDSGSHNLARPKSRILIRPLSRHHHIGRLDVAMYNAGAMRRPKSIAELDRVVDGERRREPCAHPQDVRQRLATDQLHGDEELTIIGVDFVNRNDIGMI